ncbi:Endonuclease/exonuclease/phosphatase, partial [Mycena rosella]
NHKFKFVKRMVDENRLGILAMQETHLDDCGAADFHKIYQSWFKTIHSAHPTSPNSTAGVAFLLNKKFIDVEHVQEIELIPGHALMINIPWHKGRTVTILNIYTPSTPQERDKMWTQLWTNWKNDTHLPFPNIVLGDWNFLEDTRDRLSVGRVSVPTSFKRLKSLLQIEDGWRNIFPDDRQYTFIQPQTDPATGFQHVSRSRLDRIYVHHSIFDSCRGWRIDQTAVKTDHSLIAMQIVCREDQGPGRGRFSLPIYLLKTRKFTREIQLLGKIPRTECVKLAEVPRRDNHNVKTLWCDFKQKTIDHARKCSLIMETENIRQLRTWKAQLHLVIHDQEMPPDDRTLSAYLLQKKINDTLKERAEGKHDLSQARYDVEGETFIFWTRSAAGYHMKETIHEFVMSKSPSGIPQYESRPKFMAEIGRAHHDSIQSKDKPESYAKLLATEMVLDQCDANLTASQHDSMNQRLLASELRNALKTSKNGSAPGLDGIPYEFYKWLEIELKLDPENALDIIQLLESVVADIEQHGITPGTNFNTGWMCPIYKKGDRALIANYRPITLLNVDYKFLTKGYSLRL